MVSSTPGWYEGGCYSDLSSKGATAPGCQGKIGECNAVDLAREQGVWTNADPSLATNVSLSSDEIARMQGNAARDPPCVAYDTMTTTITLDGATNADFAGYRGGVDLGSIQDAQADAAGTHSTRTEISSAEVGGNLVITTVFHFDAHAPSPTTLDVAQAAYEAQFGTAALAASSLEGVSSSYTTAISEAPTMVVEQGGDDDGGLSQGAKIGIGVGVGVGGAALLSGLAYVFLAKKKKGASKAVGVSGGANNA